MGLHTLRLGSFPKSLEGKAAIKDVKARNDAYLTTCFNIQIEIHINDKTMSNRLGYNGFVQVASPWLTPRRPRDS
jgi:hypothetical protein